MGWQGDGTFVRDNGTNTGTETWQDDAAAATKIRADRHDTHDQDLADGIAACITQNNESKPTADFLPNVDDTYDLGSSSAKWAEVHTNAVHVSGGVLYTGKGADVASASALTLGTDGNIFDITGTTTVTSIATKGVGTIIKLHFDAILTLTHHATDLILPGGANITTAAGDEAEFYEYATGDWRCTNYQRASGEGISAFIDVFTGLVTSNGTDTDHDIDVAVGSCADSTNAVRIALGSTLTKQIDADWAEGSAAGGLASGARSVANTPDASTWYHFFLIMKTDGTVDGGWDTSTTATNLLADATAYTYYKMIASHYSNASNNIDLFFQYGDRFYWSAPILSLSETNSASEVTTTLRVPPDYNVEADITVGARISANTSYLRVFTPDQPNSNGSASNFTMRLEGSSGSVYENSRFMIHTNTSGQVQHDQSGTVNVAYIQIITHGWEYNRSAL